MGHDIDKGLSATQIDFRQLQQELTGAAGGRLLRFLTPEIYEQLRADLRAEKRESNYSKLMMLLLTDPQYRRTYERVWNTLEDYERRAEQALGRVRKRIEELDAELEELRSNAAQLPDGTSIYRDASGAVRTEDGTEVSGPELEAVVWPEDATTYEQIAGPRDERAALSQGEQDIEAFQVDVLGATRNELEDGDDPRTTERLQELERRIEESAPDAIRFGSEAPSRSVRAQDPTQVAVPRF